MSSTDLLNGRDRTDDNFHCGVFFCFLAEHVSVRLVITTQSLWCTQWQNITTAHESLKSRQFSP
jgi:hypothetical protein